MHRKAPITAALVGLMLAGCVTINIYFPAAAAERVADRIIDDIWQLKPDTDKPQGGKPSQPSQ
jgi:hypothetical protein